MVPFSVVPSTLMAFLLVFPVFSMSTTPNDPFRALASHTSKQPEMPVCRLTPSSPVEPVIEDDVLLSFEEWKIKQFAMQAEAKAKAKETSRAVAAASQAQATGSSQGEQSSETLATDPPAPSDLSSLDSEDNTATELLSPHFRVPLTDRFNYASLDCSARVHLTHRSAKSPSSILSSMKDRYMLSPCSTSKGQNQFVVVELCEDIRIDTVQLANFEFFSGVFKDFTVRVAKTYTTDAEGWTVAGTYKAKNVRGVQSFHPPTSLRDFYRYIRIDFHSHYSNEYYCPVSLLRVYGLTHLEQWKWDIWEAESRAKLDELEEAKAIPSSVDIADTVESAQTTAADVSGSSEATAAQSSGVDLEHDSPANATKEQVVDLKNSLENVGIGIPSTSNITTDERVDHQVPSSSLNGTPSATTTVASAPLEASENSVTIPSIDSSTAARSTDSPTHETSRPTTTDYAPDTALPASPTFETSSILQLFNTSWDQQLPSSYDNTTITIIHSRVSSGSPSSATTVTTSVPLPQPPAPLATGGESIYRTIMNRLTALEANHTLYARYVEEQTVGVRDMLKRLGEEVGRLEGIGKAQAQMYQRTIIEWERQRNRLEMEHGELMSRVNYLSDEIVLEKRLGIAQLCLLLAVLVFMGLTRGSRGEALLDHGQATAKLNKSMREWSRRHLSFSSDWANRFRSRSPTPQPATRSFDLGKDKVEFPSSKTPLPSFVTRTPLPAEQAKQIKQIYASASEGRPTTAGIVTSASKRSRTPTSLRTPTRRLSGHPLQPVSPTGAYNASSRPLIQRANSQGTAGFISPGFSGLGPVPKSAKKWARTAHLHQVRGKDDREKNGTSSRDQVHGRDRRNRENDVDIFQSSISPLKGYPSSPPASVDDAFKLIDKKGKSPHYSTHRTPLSPLPTHHPMDAYDSADTDTWVDTDADGSELDLSSEPEVSHSPRVGLADS